MTRILVIQGHPDRAGGHFGHALAEAYGGSARAAGHDLQELSVAALALPPLGSRSDWEGAPPEPAREAQSAIASAEHIALFYPLWLGTMPAALKAFLEQVLRPGFAFSYPDSGGSPKKMLRGKSARVVVTMGMPALFYRLYFGAHGVRSLERNILRFCGIGPVRRSLIGMVEGGAGRRERWLERMRCYGARAR